MERCVEEAWLSKILSPERQITLGVQYGMSSTAVNRDCVVSLTDEKSYIIVPLSVAKRRLFLGRRCKAKGEPFDTEKEA